jgi:hypothetical protein
LAVSPGRDFDNAKHMNSRASQRALERPLTQPKSPSIQSSDVLREGTMQPRLDNQIALFIRDETTGRYVFNAQALKALGIDPAEARDRGYSLKEQSGSADLSTT